MPSPGICEVDCRVTPGFNGDGPSRASPGGGNDITEPAIGSFATAGGFAWAIGNQISWACGACVTD